MKTKVMATITAVLVLGIAELARATLVNWNSVVEEGIEYYIQTDKFVYDLGETVEMLYRVTNLTENPVNLGKVYLPPYCYNFIIRDYENNKVWHWPQQIPTAPPVDFLLVAYESKEFQITWDMVDDYYFLPVDPGTYNVTGELWAGVIVPVSVSIEIIPEPATIFLFGLGSLFLRSIHQIKAYNSLKTTSLQTALFNKARNYSIIS